MDKKSRDASSYRIGAVARMTGIALATLRVWERRYGAVVPLRTPKGGRLYTREDVTRLGMLKTAVDAGHAIGTVAGLDAEALQQRLSSMPAMSSGRRLRYAVAGPHLPQQLARVSATLPLELVREAETTASLARKLKPAEVDVVLLEYPGMVPDQARDVLGLLEQKQPRLILLTYEFASARVLRTLETASVLALRGPLEAAALVRIASACLGVSTELAPSRDSPPVLFSSQQLDRIGRVRSSLRCECPQHLTHLIRGLSSFERYSAECENLDDRDRALHQMLRRVAAQCRGQMENALMRVIESEGLGAELLAS